ncbi:MAG: LCP family protein [Thermoleophilia bacterium]
MKKNDYTFKNSPKRSQRRRRSSYGVASEPGYRRARLTARHQEKRRRSFAIIMTSGVIVAALVFVGVFLIVRAGDSPGAVSEESVGAGSSGTVIMTGKDEAGRLSQLAVLVPDTQGGYSLFTINPRTVVETPGHGFQQLAQVAELGGQELLDQSVANLLQLPIQYHLDLGYPTLEIAAEQAGIIDFRTDRPLTLASAGETVSFAAGDNPATAQRAISYLKASVEDGQTGPRVQALFYQGLHDALAMKPEPERRALAQLLLKRLETDLDDGDFIDLFVAVTTPGRAFGAWPLPVKLTGSGADWYLEPVPAEVETLMTGDTGDTGFMLEIHNGTEAPGVVEAAAERLSSLRYSTTLQTDPSGVDFENTQIRVGSEALAAGNRVRDLLGKGTIIKDEYMEKQQIIVIIGRDLSVAELEKR